MSELTKARLLNFFSFPLTLAVVLTAWELAAASGLFSPLILIPPVQVFQSFLDLLNDGQLLENLEASGQRVLSGFAIGGGLGLLVGIVLGLFPNVERYFGLLFNAVRQVPFITWGPLLIIAFGVGETFKIIIIANAAFFPVAINTLDGVRNVPRQYRDVASIFQFSRWSLIRKVIFPSAFPFILTGFRLALSRCWMIVVAAELFASSSGIGHMMDWARQMFRIDIVMVGVIVTGIIGFTLDRLLRSIENRFTSWKPRAV